MVLNSEYNLLGIILNNPDIFYKLKKNIFLNKKCFELYEIIDIEMQKNKGFTKEILLDTLKSNKVLTEEDFYEIYDFGYDSLNFDLYFNFVLNKWALHKADLLIKDIRKQNIKTTVDLQNELQKIIKEIAVDEENISDSQEIILKIIDDLNNNVNVNLIRSNIKYIDSYGGL